MNSICRFIPAQKSPGTLSVIHFVYETEWKKLTQPFLNSIFYMYLVTRGNAKMHMADKDYNLSEGTLFFTFPGIEYTFDGSDDFSFFYISYMGSRSVGLMEEYGVTVERPVFDGFSDEIEFWRNAIQRVNPQNAPVLSEGVMLYTLSFLDGNNRSNHKDKFDHTIDSVVRYLENNAGDPSISLKKVADIFAYSEKYLSHLFNINMNTNWSVYINRVRIQKAIKMIDDGETDLAQIAANCGYRDPMYFVKVFKKNTGFTPREFLNRQENVTTEFVD